MQSNELIQITKEIVGEEDRRFLEKNIGGSRLAFTLFLMLKINIDNKGLLVEIV